MGATPQFRPALASIPAYRAGKPPTVGDRPAYKLSSNENPYPPLPGVVEAAVAAVKELNRYPDMGVSRLHAALAERWHVDPACIASGPGSVAALYHLLQASCTDGDEVIYAWRSFEAYPIAVGLTGARSVQVPVDAFGRHDLKAMAAAITDDTKVVVVCTPNNPTGPSVHRNELLEFVDSVPPTVLIVIDEAYHEFIDDEDRVDGLEVARGRDNVVVLRTFSKAYGLAGIRVGYAVAAPPVAEAIRKCALPFAVSAVAQAAAVASLAAEPELMKRVEALKAERARVCDALLDQGWQIPAAQGNFLWLPLGDAAGSFAEAADAAGVSIRPFDGDGVRVSIGEPEANDIFLAVAGKWLQRFR
jgi:histidinol-phosphate aminotransferase